jgi:hypothetical protein
MENLFALSRDSFETAFSNLETIQNQSETLLQLFMTQPNLDNPKLEKNCNEWVSDSRKALSDYRQLVLKGLDYLVALKDSPGKQAK